MYKTLAVDKNTSYLQLQPDSFERGLQQTDASFEALSFLGLFLVGSFLIVALNSLEVKNDQYKERDCDERIELMKIKLRFK